MRDFVQIIEKKMLIFSNNYKNVKVFLQQLDFCDKINKNLKNASITGFDMGGGNLAALFYFILKQTESYLVLNLAEIQT